MKRFLSVRYPYYGINHDNIGTISVQVGVVVFFVSGFLTFRLYTKSEGKRKTMEKNFKEVNPNDIVPFAKDIVPVDRDKLLRAVQNKSEFIRKEFEMKVVKSPEEYVFLTTKGVKNKTAFMNYLSEKFKEVNNQ